MKQMPALLRLVACERPAAAAMSLTAALVRWPGSRPGGEEGGQQGRAAQPGNRIEGVTGRTGSYAATNPWMEGNGRTDKNRLQMNPTPSKGSKAHSQGAIGATHLFVHDPCSEGRTFGGAGDALHGLSEGPWSATHGPQEPQIVQTELAAKAQSQGTNMLFEQ